MNKVFGVILLLTLPFSFVKANVVVDCPDVEIEIDDHIIEIDGLSAPIEIVKVFNTSYNLIFECNGNCPEDINLTDLTDGDYYIDIQSYTSNWRLICDKKEVISISNQGISTCNDTEVLVKENQLEISGLSAPNKIIKIFDVFYNLIDICFANCGDTFIVPNLLTGIYHIDIQFYTTHWQFICNQTTDVLIDLEVAPCDDSACLGNVHLKTQKEVDEFCGCPVIAGNLTIGQIAGSNINSLVNLRDLVEIKGTFEVKGTRIKNIDGLGNLGTIGKNLTFEKNTLLTNFQGLNNLVTIGQTFKLIQNPKLENLNGLDRWTFTKAIDFVNNNNLKKVDQLAQINGLQVISIIRNGKLEQLPRLTELDTLFGLTLTDNTLFENLDFLESLDFLTGSVNIKANSSLTNCCGLTHLIDDDPFFGDHSAVFTIQNNPFSCQTISAILNDCQTTAPSCDDIDITGIGGGIRISGLAAANEIIKIFDENYRTIFDCFGNCEEVLNLNNLSNGSYWVNINFYNQNWIPICEKVVNVILDNNGITTAVNDRSKKKKLSNNNDFSLTPNPAKETTFLDLSGHEGATVQLQLSNQFGQRVWERYIEKVVEPTTQINLSFFQNGIYFLQIKTANRRLITKKLIVNDLY